MTATMTATAETTLACPNCGTEAVVPVPGKTKCPGRGCPYYFRSFSKRDHDAAKEFYLTRPSKRLKYLRQAQDERWFVAFCRKVEAFITDNLFDLIDPQALQTIQMGLSERLERPISIMVKFWEDPHAKFGANPAVKLIPKDGEWFGRVDPVNPRDHYCLECEKIRSFSQGEDRCVNYDIEVTRGIVGLPNPSSQWAPCWAGLVDFAIPVVINDFVAAVFFTGQIRWTDPEGSEAIKRGNKAVADIVPISVEELQALANDAAQQRADKAKLERLRQEQYEPEVKRISEIAENRYWAERRVREAEFLTEVFASFAAVDNEQSLWKALDLVLGRLCEFSHFRYAAFMLSHGNSPLEFAVRTTCGFTVDSGTPFVLAEEEYDRLFEKERPYVVKQANEVKDTSILDRLFNLLQVRVLNCVLLFPCQFANDAKGIILIADRTEVMPGRAKHGRLSERRKDFLERVAHEIEVEVDSQLAISDLQESLREKTELMANAGHVLVAPLGSIYGKSERLQTLLGSGDPAQVQRYSEESGRICRSLDKDVERAIRQLRSYMFVATMGTDAEEYRFDRAIPMGALLSQLIDDFEYAAERRGISIEQEIEDGMPPANFDRDKLEIALSNLFDNAIKYSHRDRTIKVGASFDKDHAVFTIFISDFGLGIPDAELEAIFDKLHRSRVKDPRRYIPGTGLGLAMVRQIVSKHGGKVWATSRQGIGARPTRSIAEGFSTTFWIQLHRHRSALL